jgi:hypothetical protein
LLCPVFHTGLIRFGEQVHFDSNRTLSSYVRTTISVMDLKLWKATECYDPREFLQQLVGEFRYLNLQQTVGDLLVARTRQHKKPACTR